MHYIVVGSVGYCFGAHGLLATMAAMGVVPANNTAWDIANNIANDIANNIASDIARRHNACRSKCPTRF